MPITALPSAPLPTDTQAAFNTKAFAWVAALATWTTEANALAVTVNGYEANSLSYKNLAANWAYKTDGIVDAVDYSAKAWAIGGTGVTTVSGASKEWAIKTDGAVTSGQYSAKAWSIGGTGVTDAAGAAKEWAIKQSGTVDGSEYSAKYYSVMSAMYAAASASASNAVIWVSGTTYAPGDVRYSPIDFQSYRRKTSGAGTTDPSADTTNWTQISGGGDVDGPAGAIDGQLAGFDGVTGKLIKGIASASQAEMEAGTEAALRGMSPLNVAQAINSISISKAEAYYFANF